MPLRLHGLERHEELAEQFLWVTGITVLPAALVLILRRPGAIRALTGMTVIGALFIAVAVVRVGYAGGQLVCVHNAATLYTLAVIVDHTEETSFLVLVSVCESHCQPY